MAILGQVSAIIEEAREDGTLPLTDQQIFYAMAGKYKFPKSLKARKRLGAYLQKAKRANTLGTQIQCQAGSPLRLLCRFAGTNFICFEPIA
jgi:hypothetical protein